MSDKRTPAPRPAVRSGRRSRRDQEAEAHLVALARAAARGDEAAARDLHAHLLESYAWTGAIFHREAADQALASFLDDLGWPPRSLTDHEWQRLVANHGWHAELTEQCTDLGGAILLRLVEDTLLQAATAEPGLVPLDPRCSTGRLRCRLARPAGQPLDPDALAEARRRRQARTIEEARAWLEVAGIEPVPGQELLQLFRHLLADTDDAGSDPAS